MTNNTNKPLKLMAILAHPDDESLGFGGILAKYAAEGVETYLVTATRGERGWFGPPEENPGLETLGRIREAELHNAARVLGLQQVSFLDYVDGELDQADPTEAICRIVGHLRRVRPDVVVTFDPYGAYGHPDHIAVSQFTTAAVVAAADPTFRVAGLALPHRVKKLYYRGFAAGEERAYETAFGDLVMNIDGVERRTIAWPGWAFTTVVNTLPYWERVWQAVECHQSQLTGYQALKALPDSYHQQLWGKQTFYRAFSFANGGHKVEDDLFEGLRNKPAAQTFTKATLFSTPRGADLRQAQKQFA